MTRLTIGAILFLFTVKPSEADKPPNILFILADDYGWHDIGYHNSAFKTPVLDKLASDGVKLERYYVQPICTPTRSQLLTGRYQIHTGLQHGAIYPPVPEGLPLSFPTLADKLKETGYATHMIGKWHLGYYKKEYTPTYRGFDSFYGFYISGTDYYNHTRCVTFNHRECCGLDLHDNLDLDRSQNGVYSSDLFSTKTEEVLENHVKSGTKKPLFMYLALQSVHRPLQVPEKYKNIYPFIKDDVRRTYAGMVSAMDEAINNVTEAFKKYGLWDNTLLVFSTDNGGDVIRGGNNWPLRGMKETMWEGGVRGVGFVGGPALPAQAQGKVSHELIHVSDWFPTLLHVAAGNYTDMELDGFNVWDTISQDDPSPRTELLHNIDPLSTPVGKRWSKHTFDNRYKAAIRMGRWKLLTGDPGFSERTPPPENDVDIQTSSTYTINAEERPSEITEESLIDRILDIIQTKLKNHRQDTEGANHKSQYIEDDANKHKHKKNLWLFDIVSDPNEELDLSDKRPDLVRSMLDRLQYYSETAVKAQSPKFDDRANPEKNGGAWQPWLN